MIAPKTISTSPIVRAWHWLMGAPPRDHRGRRVSIIFLSALPFGLATRISGLPQQVHTRAVAELFQRNPPRLWKQGLVIFVMFTAMTVPFVFCLKPLLAHTMSIVFGSIASTITVTLVSGLLPAVVSTIWIRRHYRPLTISTTLKFNHCPSCGYSLAFTQPDPADGCTVCPECGAAWRFPPTQPS